MKKSDLLKMAGNPNFISGIYNYCDHWCERCSFTARCMTFAIEQEEEPLGGEPPDRKAFWKQFETSLQLTEQLIEDMAKEHGVTFDPAELAEIGRQEALDRRETEQHPIARAGIEYSKLVEQWFKSGEHELREKEAELLAQARLGVGTVKAEVASLTDIVEILRWYQYQIHVKLRRGLRGHRSPDSPSGSPSNSPRDADGSVKVALIAIDRSIAAWMKMRDFFPTRADSILSNLVHLDRLRRAAETEFPKARSFVRPGFDTVAQT